MRRIIQISGDGPCALCDDGTVWYMSVGGEWYKRPDIPQDKPQENKITFEKISQERNEK